MTRQTQGLVLGFVGTVLLRLVLSDEYLRYVTEWMKWPILTSGLLLTGLAIGPIFRDPQRINGHRHDHGVPASAWLLLLPGLVVFTISPPELGSYLAERRANQAAPQRPASDTSLDDDGPVALPISELVWRAEEGGRRLSGREVILVGFVTRQDDDWFVTRLTIGCCAADAVAFRAKVEGADPPPRDQWVTVTGRYVDGTGTEIRSDPVVAATEVVATEKPKRPYE